LDSLVVSLLIFIIPYIWEFSTSIFVSYHFAALAGKSRSLLARPIIVMETITVKREFKPV
jgi:hypothetical protein